MTMCQIMGQADTERPTVEGSVKQVNRAGKDNRCQGAPKK